MDNKKYLQEVLKSQDLQEDSDELKQLQVQRTKVEELLCDSFSNSSPTICPGGSVAKGSLIREAYDLDIICYFPNDDTGAGDTLEDIFNNVYDALSKEYLVERKTSALRLRSKDPGTFAIDFHIDVVPGRYTDESKTDCFIHQNSGEKKRLKTNLQVHIDHVKNSGVLDALRLLKLWKVRRSLKVKQFVFDLLVIKLLERKRSADLPNQLLHVWKELKESTDPIVVEDPANPTGNDLSGLLKDVWPELSSTAGATLSTIENSGWEAVFKIEKATTAERIEILKRAAAAVPTPTKPWLPKI